MTFLEERTIVLDAVCRAAQEAAIPWPPVTDHPVPLSDYLGAYPVTHDEVPSLTRAGAAAYLARWNIERPELWEDSTPLAGFLFANDAGGYVLVRREDPIARRRFSAAHEFGHYLLHLPPQLEDARPGHIIDDAQGVVTEDVLPDRPDLDAMERQANLFAAELLMPAQVCVRLIEKYGRQGYAGARFLADQLSLDLLVSREAVRWRLKSLTSLGLLPRRGVPGLDGGAA
ncbi:ImmA/IrrE family metallo-endopeptidase [Zavarzinella formosa]|uniref:ImmA/IrrE family metallo-endopeptidase n=1 Tax=Zavarzinella formosa TaxID=360055 RepID=UPI000365F358|nr:ImmA/IrrE family metallo-endopeptidase [Zavarzinella formosa]